MNAAEAQLEVASHLAEAQQQLARAVLACGDYLYLTRIRANGLSKSVVFENGIFSPGPKDFMRIAPAAFPLLLKRSSRSAGIPARTGAKAAAGCGTEKCQCCEWRCFRSRNDC
jgi:hypothetical protein